MSPPTSTQLEAWLTQASLGDNTARERLVEHTYQRLLDLTRRLLRAYPYLRQFEESTDVLHNAQKRLYDALGGSRPPTLPDFYRLAGTVLRRELVDLVRHYFGPQGEGANRAAPAPSTEPGGSGHPPHEQPGSSLDPARLAGWTEFHRQVEALPAEEKEVFDLLYYQELPQAEAAQVLGVSLATLKRRWLAARRRLGQFLEPDNK
jgi:RNA polymerase sigma-70 factor (ECF subfamily)